MRQKIGAELSFVSLFNTDSYTEITIDGNSLNEGNFDLFLESFDEANTVHSILKTDKITISVVSPLDFIEPLE